jgi:hypothetical protein
MKREGEVCDFIVGQTMKRHFPIVFAATFALGVKSVLIKY